MSHLYVPRPEAPLQKGVLRQDQNWVGLADARLFWIALTANSMGDRLVGMVVGIFPDTKALKTIVDGLKSSGADIDRLRVLTYDEVPTELATSGIEFVWLGDVERGVDPGNLGTGGTGVPGLNTARSSSPNEVHGDELLESLSELGIPDGRTDDYAHAVEGGRMIVGFPAWSDSAMLHQLYSSNGATTVEEF